MISLCTFVQKSIQRGMEKELSAVEHNLSQLERKRKIYVKESVDGQSAVQEVLYSICCEHSCVTTVNYSRFLDKLSILAYSPGAPQ